MITSSLKRWVNLTFVPSTYKVQQRRNRKTGPTGKTLQPAGLCYLPTVPVGKCLLKTFLQSLGQPNRSRLPIGGGGWCRAKSFPGVAEVKKRDAEDQEEEKLPHQGIRKEKINRNETRQAHTIKHRTTRRPRHALMRSVDERTIKKNGHQQKRHRQRKEGEIVQGLGLVGGGGPAPRKKNSDGETKRRLLQQVKDV